MSVGGSYVCTNVRIDINNALKSQSANRQQLGWWKRESAFLASLLKEHPDGENISKLIEVANTPSNTFPKMFHDLKFMISDNLVLLLRKNLYFSARDLFIITLVVFLTPLVRTSSPVLHFCLFPLFFDFLNGLSMGWNCRSLLNLDWELSPSKPVHYAWVAYNWA